MTSTRPSRSRPRAAVIYNPIKVKLPELKAEINTAATTAGWARTRWYPTSVEDPGGLIAAEAIADGASLVFAAGGDGTVRAVAETLRGSGIPLSLVPSGTGNLLARNLDLPLSDLATAALIGFTGHSRPIDMGVMSIEREDAPPEEHAFLVMAGIGLDATIMANTSAMLKRTVGWLAYVDAGVRTLATAKPFRLHYRLEGRSLHSVNVSTILFANCGSLPGGLELLPDSSVDDGKLDLAVLQPAGLFGWVRIWRKLRWENGSLRRSRIGQRIITVTRGRKGTKTISYLRTRSVTVRLDEPQGVELDGDQMGVTRSVTVRTDPHALLVRVPATDRA
ncbi:diacylglycerol/lipid kinase family protein [Mycetocola spongiae]|uniref:diacylglycerol/lipid kinase family protein n=1 Tax=Mycetocola spongiae TaxID=2859226 RepID=UPI001CF5779C|nr:diacylglycerol kinase family protein [Mycetocola spongiae]UCR88124.1 diacylglycerol kinase family lipid kinase [Mycetocola spongiae]